MMEMNAPSQPVGSGLGPFDSPITFVKCNNEREIHIFLTDTFEWSVVQEITNNFRYDKPLAELPET